MKQSELIEEIQEHCRQNGPDLSKGQVEAVLKAFGATVVAACKKEDEVPFPGVGKFKGKKQEERTARNPKTGETLTVPAKVVGKFEFNAAAKSTIGSD